MCVCVAVCGDEGGVCIYIQIKPQHFNSSVLLDVYV